MMPAAWAPTVPGAITGLIAALTKWPALEGVKVYDGPEVSSATELEVISVGFAGERMSTTGEYPEPSQPVIESAAQVEGLAVMPQAEAYTIRSMLAVLHGDGMIQPARERAYELLAACASALAADKTLGGAVQMARLGSHMMLQEQIPRGAIVTIYWDTAVSAYSKRVT